MLQVEAALQALSEAGEAEEEVITFAPVTILRAERPGGSDMVSSPEGASVERVVYPRPGLGG